MLWSICKFVVIILISQEDVEAFYETLIIPNKYL